MITRFDLAKRWKCSTRKVDRIREEGLLAWVDLSQGRGARPCVRFRIEDVEEYERRARLCSREGAEGLKDLAKRRVDPETRRAAI